MRFPTKRRSFNSFATVALVAAVVSLTGCGPKIPEIVPVTGTVTIDGRPYQYVMVKFIPLQPGLDGNMTASGMTDEEGKFTLTLSGQDTPGACACACAVTITEGPIPDSIRNSENEQIVATKYLASLKDRPIPVIYTRMADSPLKVDVTPEQTSFELKVQTQ